MSVIGVVRTRKSYHCEVRRILTCCYAGGRSFVQWYRPKAERGHGQSEDGQTRCAYIHLGASTRPSFDFVSVRLREALLILQRARQGEAGSNDTARLHRTHIYARNM